MDLTQADIDFFTAQENWSGGPMYEICLYISREYDSGYVLSAVRESADLSVWDESGSPKCFKTILPISGLVPVGLVHSYLHAQRPFREFAVYSLSIYPPQCHRALGGFIHGEEGLEFENWPNLDTEKVRLFHSALFSLVHNFARKVPLVGASINTEDRGMAHPYTTDGSICISPNVAQILGLKAVSIEGSCGFFVGVRPD